MVNDNQRNLLKAQDHLIELCNIIASLQDEPMSQRHYAETMSRLRKLAHLAAQRIGKMVDKETSMFDRMEFETEKNSPYSQNPLLTDTNGA